MLKTIVEWEDKFENNYKEFKEVIFNFVKTIDDKHYDWCVGENIIYSRSARDNVAKSFYCVVLGDNGYKRFKKLYLDKVFYRKKDNVINGSAISMLDAVKNLHSYGIPIEKIVRMACTNPALIMHQPTIGKILPGQNANIIVMDKNLNLLHTIINGKFYKEK